MVALNVFALAAILPAMALGSAAGPRAHSSVQRRHHNKVKIARAAIPGERNTARALKRKRSIHRKRKCRPVHSAAATSDEQQHGASEDTWIEQAPPAEPSPGGNDNEWESDPVSDAAPVNPDFGNEFHAEATAELPTAVVEVAPEQSTAAPQQASGTTFGGDFRLGRTLSGPCGAIQTNDNCPNGEQWWLNCGISLDNHDSEWAPPFMGLDDIVYQDFNHGDWAGCEAYAWAFNDPEVNLGVNPAILAAIARQESSCNPDIRGKNGEYGLMQVMPFNCLDEANCMDVYMNIKSGANVFKTYLEASGGNVLLALGKYNGWKEKLTYNQATMAYNEGNCWAQNNLDYLHQMLNGFVVGRNAYEQDFHIMFSKFTNCSRGRMFRLTVSPENYARCS